MPDRKISLLVPSRERLNLKLTLISSIITSVKDINNVELLFGIDDDDPTRDTTYKIADAIPFVKIIPIHNDGRFIGINKIWNILADNCENDILGYVGDDMVFRTINWDALILEEFNEINLPNDNIKLVHCYDGHRQTDEISVNAFIHRKYCDVLGYMCKEEFLINWSDQWMYQTFKAFDRVKYRRDIQIDHNHWIYGVRKRDGVADRMLSDNHDGKSNKMWHDLENERIQDVLKLGEYLGINPEWKYVDQNKYK